MSEESNIECATCGRPIQPYPECGMCHGTAQVQSRAYTLSDERAGRVPKEQRHSRYGETGAVGPKIVNLPGSGPPGGGLG